MKTFDDLGFVSHGTGGVHAVLRFDNGYLVSVVSGSNGVDTFELDVGVQEPTEHDPYAWSLTYDTPVTDDVLGCLSKDEVTAAMRQVQELEEVRA